MSDDVEAREKARRRDLSSLFNTLKDDLSDGRYVVHHGSYLTILDREHNLLARVTSRHQIRILWNTAIVRHLTFPANERALNRAGWTGWLSEAILAALDKADRERRLASGAQAAQPSKGGAS